MLLRVIAYPPEGHSDAPVLLGQADTLDAARRLVRRTLGVQRLAPVRRFASSDEKENEEVVESWNARPPSHPEAYGCAVLDIVTVV